jgi:hypothetical protein
MSATEKKPASTSPRPTRPEWQSEMHTHFQKTGAVRAKDIIRVLGNPLESVDVATPKQSSFGRIDRE